MVVELIKSIPTRDKVPDLEPPIVTVPDDEILKHSCGPSPIAGEAASTGSTIGSGTGAHSGFGHNQTASHSHGIDPVHPNDLNALPGETKDERHIDHHPFKHTTTETGQKIMPVARDRSAPGNVPHHATDENAKLPYGVTHAHDTGVAGRTMPDQSVHLAHDHPVKTDVKPDGKESIGSKIKHAVQGGGYTLK
jgi:hypothetical protein